MSAVTKPNLFIVGVPKSGTTSLAINLTHTGDVYLPNIKEPNYFIDQHFSNAVHIQSLKEYHKLYTTNKKYKYLCDASTSYIYDKQTAKKIKKYNPESKVIILLRDPVERAYSHYNMEKNVYKRERLDFMTAMDIDNRHDYFGFDVNPYIEPSLYYEQVKEYIETFATEQLKIIILENTLNINKDIEDFLYIKNIANEKYNENKKVRNGIFSLLLSSSILRNIRKILPNNLKQYLAEHLIFRKVDKVNLDESFKKNLYLKFFKDDINKLEKLLNQDLSSWKH